jgi:Family of unknown function (DUF6114)/zinc-ribbon domain
MSPAAPGSSPPGYPPQYAPGGMMVAPGQSHEKPTTPMVLSIIGGVFIFLAGLAELWLGSIASSLSFGLIGGSLILFGALGALLGILIIVFAVLLHAQPQHKAIFGVLIIVFSVVSLTSFFGGFVLGFILALIGGILALTWKPSAPTVVVMQNPPVQRICPKCGQVVDPNVSFCPRCGNSLS